MKSPFPGMDPYLEQHWLDVHATLAIEARVALNQRLPEDLIAKVEQRVAVEADLDEEHAFRADVRIAEVPPIVDIEENQSVAAGVLAPYRVVVELDPVKERFVQIIEAANNRLITVIEFLSPSNKRGVGMRAFRIKRADLLAAGVNFVEIDLVRAGDWQQLMLPHRPSARLSTAYRIAFRVPEDSMAVHLFPVDLKERLPEIRIPLRPNDPEVRVDMQTLVDDAYESGRYFRQLDYKANCEPPLKGEEAAWADSLLRAAGKR